MSYVPQPRYDLPSDPMGAMRELRRRMVEEWRPILEHLSFPVVATSFGVDYESDVDRTRAFLSVGFGKFPQSEWQAVQEEFDRVSSQWASGGSLRSGPQTGFGLIGGCTVSGCGWDLDSGKVYQVLAGGDFDGHVCRVPELMPPMLLPGGAPATPAPGGVTANPLPSQANASGTPIPSDSPPPAAGGECHGRQGRPRLNLS